ncbi:hypothetical protein [Streptomyces naphthomycinicus]|uniref:hypothetical protein n=1 Tax=Streptomyces naphthomycinicus TaxID=2872625 RepID=UPI001CEC2B17|nr:hypothetical protein [Streptomyces sp. TML10]
MNRISRKQRFAMLAATATMAAGGALLPSGAFAAPAPHSLTVAAADHHHHDRADQNKVTTVVKTSTRTSTKSLPGHRLQLTITETRTVIKIRNGDVISKKTTVVKRQQIVDMNFHNSHHRDDDNENADDE